MTKNLTRRHKNNIHLVASMIVFSRSLTTSTQSYLVACERNSPGKYVSETMFRHLICFSMMQYARA